jgi:hypothetical protein
MRWGIMSSESGAVSLLLLLLVRAGVEYPGSRASRAGDGQAPALVLVAGQLLAAIDFLLIPG